MELPESDKKVWTEADFENMGWHDAQLHAVAFADNPDSWTGDLLMDVDYIFKWHDPTPPDDFFSFHIAPCTLIFKNVFELKLNLNTGDFNIGPNEIERIQMQKELKEEYNEEVTRWMIHLQTGYITFIADGFTMHVRQEPILTRSQVLTAEQRKGISFSTATW